MAEFRADTNAATVAGSLAGLGRELGDLEPVNREAGRLVLAAARPPHRSGALAAGLQADVTAGGVETFSTVPYWTFVHWGAPRRHVKAQPFLLAALQATKDDVIDLYTTHARDAVSRAT